MNANVVSAVAFGVLITHATIAAAQQQPAGAGGASPPAATAPRQAPSPGQAQQATPATQPAMQSQVPAMPPLPGAAANPGRQALEDALPVTPEEVRELRRRLDALQQASSRPTGPAPKPVSSSVSITQSPGETPPVVRLAVGHVTSVVFVDATGAPWPVAFAVPGDASKFQVTVATANSPSVEINQLTAYPHGNINVTLKDNPIPVSISLISGQREVDARLDVRILKRGPQAAAPIIDRAMPEIAGKIIGDILDGIPPGESVPLRSSMAGIQAWRMGGKMYLRTKLPLLSPAWTESITSPDGTRAYELPETPIVLVSVEGRTASVSIGD